MKPQFTIGVFVVVFNEQKQILLCRRRDFDFWNLPGGGLETDETPWQGAVREVKEETGLEIKIIKLSGIYSKTEKNEIVFCFIGQPVDGQIELNEEVREIKYFSFDTMPSNLLPKHRERIKDAMEDSHEVVMKIQNGQSSIELMKNS